MINSSFVKTAIRYGMWLLYAAGCLIIPNKIAPSLIGLSVWDDSYMFIR